MHETIEIPRPRVLLVEDDESLRKVLRKVLRLDGRLDVVAEAADGIEAIALAAELQPDLVLLDVRMPGMDGLEALPLVAERAPRSTVVMLSMIQDPKRVETAMAQGAAAFVDKTTEPKVLVDSLLKLLQERAQPDSAPIAAASTDGPEVRPTNHSSLEA